MLRQTYHAADDGNHAWPYTYYTTYLRPWVDLYLSLYMCVYMYTFVYVICIYIYIIISRCLVHEDVQDLYHQQHV